MTAASWFACLVAGAALALFAVHSHGYRPTLPSAAPIDDSLWRAEQRLLEAERLQAIEVEQANHRETLQALCLQARVLVRRGDPRALPIAAVREACPLPDVSP